MMKVCDLCGKKFDEEDARDFFEIETVKNYDYFTKCLCGDCAVEAIENQMDDIYFEICDNCGTRFNPFEDELELERQTNDCGAELYASEKILCLDCALNEYRKQ